MYQLHLFDRIYDDYDNIIDKKVIIKKAKPEDLGFECFRVNIYDRKLNKEKWNAKANIYDS